MSTITVKRGIQFRADLFNKPDHTAWFNAVGQELQNKGLSLKVGDGANAKVVKDAATLAAAMKERLPTRRCAPTSPISCRRWTTS
jgi:Tfp pilus assembly protein PilZ